MAQVNGIQKKTFEEVQIPVPWGHISGKWWGSRTKQPILAIHGWQDNAGTFDNLAPLMVERGHSLLCIDLPGHGLSSHYAPGYYYYLFWDGVHVVRRIVKFFNWKDIIIIGHSLGGGIAFMYASVFPNEIKQYISIDIASPLARPPEKMMDALHQSVDKFLEYENLTKQQQPCYEYEDMIDIVESAHNGSLTRENCKVMMIRGMQPAKDQPNRYVFQRDPRLKVPALAFMTLDQVVGLAGRIQCEVMNIRAEPGYKFEMPYNQILDCIEKNAKKVERHVVAGTHHVHLNDAESIIDIIHNFLTNDLV